MSKTETTLVTRPDFVVSRIGLHELHIDPLNVRKIDAEEDPVLTASIQAHGLQTPLIVRKNASGYGVVAGGKRLLSLQKLYPDPLAVLVPCVVMDHKTPDLAVIEASLAENVARAEMHQVDEFRTYKALLDNGLSIDEIAKRFHKSTRQVEQRLALGNLHPAVLDAFVENKIGVEGIRAFTMIASQKTQKSVLDQIKAGKIQPHGWYIRKAAGLTDDQRVGKYLQIVTREAYEARGGKITEDLFGAEHVVSDPALVVTMVNELIEAKRAELLADGWKEVVTVEPGDWWRYNRVSPKIEPTKAEQKELKRLAAIVEAAEEADGDDEGAGDAYAKLEAEIAARAITPQMRAKAIVYVSVNHKGDALELDCRYPPRAEPKAEAKKEAKAAEKAKLPVEDTISQALIGRLNDTLTSAAAIAIQGQRHVAIAGLIAALTSRHSETVRVRYDGNSYDPKAPAFTLALRDALKLTQSEQIDLLVKLISEGVSMRSYRGAALDDDNHRALAEAIDGQRLTKYLRATFDAASYFDSVSKVVIEDAVREAMGEEHAAKIGRMDKASAAKFATENVMKTKWLPKQLRVKGYDGPAKKAAKAKPAAKKAKR